MRDLQYAIRFLWIHKSFTVTAVLTLAIGLGANTALTCSRVTCPHVGRPRCR